MIDTTIIIISIFFFVYIKKFNVLKQIAYGGRLESDFQGCYIISYPKVQNFTIKVKLF